MKILIDPGHGGKDPGAVSNKLQEKDINLLIGLKVGKLLQGKNIEVIYSRISDIFLTLKERSDRANESNVDIFVSVHSNSAENTAARGVETYHYPNSVEGAKLANTVHKSIADSGIFTHDRGVKTANFHVLRETKMPAILLELGFISNVQDVEILRTKQDEIAEAIAKGILNYLGIKYVEGRSILSKPSATIEQMQEWAKGKKAHQKFIELAPLYYEISEKAGVNPVVTYCQSAKETGYMRFGGVLDITFNNPCGMKTSAGGPNQDPSAHQRFANWIEGITAQVDHLALYAGAPGYPKSDTPDPRHFPYIKETAKTVEELGGKWAGSLSYGTDIIAMMKEVENIVVKETEEEEEEKEELKTIKINLHGRPIETAGIIRDNTNYISVRFLEKMGYDLDWQDEIVIIEYAENKR